MKTYAGSLQKRGNRYYLVVRTHGHQRWIALKTGKLPLARTRAALIAPCDPDDETAWLLQLVREGDLARKRLARLRAVRELTWKSLPERCAATVDADATEDNRACHAHWLELAAGLALKLKTSPTPGSLSCEEASQIVRVLGGSYLSAPRMVGYFRRVWKTLSLGDGVWPTRKTARAILSAKVAEHYRRLSVDEISRLHSLARQKSQALADMVAIGYSTGLRLSDVAELELAEIDLPFLRVCPNKTRRSKPIPLKIPLTAEARELVGRLRSEAESRGEANLFAASLRKRPTRKLTPLFRACGIRKEGSGRASFHSLRATFISLMDDAGVPPHVTDSITGHGGGGMHARYTQPSDRALLEAVEKALPALTTLTDIDPFAAVTGV